MTGLSKTADVQILNVLEAVAQIAQEGVVEVLEHAALADDVAHTFGPYDCYTASASGRGMMALPRRGSISSMTDLHLSVCT